VDTLRDRAITGERSGGPGTQSGDDPLGSSVRALEFYGFS